MSSISSAGVDIAFQALLSLVVVLPLAGEEVAVLDAAGGKTEPSAWGVLSYFKPAAQKGAAFLLLSLTAQVQGFHIVRFCFVLLLISGFSIMPPSPLLHLPQNSCNTCKRLLAHAPQTTAVQL